MSLILDQKNYMLEVLAVLSLGLLAKCHLADGLHQAMRGNPGRVPKDVARDSNP
jgi:hypothetical protein